MEIPYANFIRYFIYCNCKYIRVIPAEFVRKAFDTVLLNIEEGNETSNKIRHSVLKYALLIVAFAISKGVFMFFMRQTIIVMS